MSSKQPCWCELLAGRVVVSHIIYIYIKLPMPTMPSFFAPVDPNLTDLSATSELCPFAGKSRRCDNKVVCLRFWRKRNWLDQIYTNKILENRLAKSSKSFCFSNDPISWDAPSLMICALAVPKFYPSRC